MKKNVLIALMIGIFCLAHNAEAQYNPFANNDKLLNAGIGISGWGVPIYASIEFGVVDNISVGAGLSYQSDTERVSNFKWSHDILGIMVFGNYHLNEVLDIPDQFDLYAGLSLGYYSWSTKSNDAVINYGGSGSGGLGIAGQIGGRYFVTDNVGINLELGGGSVLSSGRLGVTVTF